MVVIVMGRTPHARRVVVALVAMALVVLLAPARGSAAVVQPTLLALVTTPDAVSVSGTGSATITITAHILEPYVSVSCGMDPDTPARLRGNVVVAWLRAAGPTSSTADVYPNVVLSLASGTVADGVWSGTFDAVATMPGAWRIGGLSACSSSGLPVALDPVAAGLDRTVTITGTGAPRLEIGSTPGVIGVRQPRHRSRAVAADGRPLAGAWIKPDSFVGCFDAAYVPGLPVTGADGIGPAWPAATEIECVSGGVGPVVLWFRGVDSQWYFSPVTARPSTARVLRGGVIAVRGVVGANGGDAGRAIIVAVQRQLSPHVWRTVASGVLRASQRYDVLVRMRWCGTVHLRAFAWVVAPDGQTPFNAPTSSRPVAVTVACVAR